MNHEASKSILVVDDDPIILIAINETLSNSGLKVTTASGAHKALEIMEHEQFAVIVSDQRMPQMTGLEFLNKVKSIQPLASRILITGVLSLDTIIDSVNKGEIFRFIAKPWLREEFLATIQNAYSRYKLQHANISLQGSTQLLNEELAEANHQLQDHLAELEETNKKLDKANETLTQNFDHVLDLCYRLIDAFHPLLGKETRMIVDVCQAMINEGKFTEEEAHVFKVSAWLKNIGLIGVSREIILHYRNAPDQLAEEDLAMIQNAPIVAQTLGDFVDNLRSVGRTLRAQNERWDGSGYPDGLAGELIPKMARHLAVASYYIEAGVNNNEAIETIIDESGNYFEPEAVRLFLKAIKPLKSSRQIKEILFSELEPGMILSNGIYSQSGILLIPEGKILTTSIVNKIKNYNSISPIRQRILVLC